MKKILFVSHALPPYLYPQSIQIGRFLNELKKTHEVYILRAAEEAAPDRTLYPGLFDGIDPARICAVPYRHYPRLNYIRNRFIPVLYNRPDIYRSWMEQAFQTCIRQFAGVRFDAIATFSFPLSLNLLGARLKAHYHCPWVAHQSDPWADNPFMHYGPVERLVNKGLEAECWARADRLVFTSVEAAAYYRRLYPAHDNKISFINHSYDPALYPARPQTNGLDRKVIRYIGGFYGERTARPLLEAVRRLPESAKKDLRFEIIGANLKTRVMIQHAALPYPLIEATGRVDYAHSLSSMASSDALLVIDAPIERDNIFFPSKLADYIGANRPIIGISSPGPTDRILKSFDYPCFPHEQVDALIGTFEAVAAGQLGVNDNPALKADYLDTVNGQKLAGILDAV